jgi:starvation-inducible DNA-binding protein
VALSRQLAHLRLHSRVYHLLLDKQADSDLASVDILAERVRKIGGATIRSVSHVSALQTIVVAAALVPPLEMMRRSEADNRHVAAMGRTTHEVCDRHRDDAMVSLPETIIDETERRIWLLQEVAVGGEHTA